jgi:hypothetical protein
MPESDHRAFATGQPSILASLVLRGVVAAS